MFGARTAFVDGVRPIPKLVQDSVAAGSPPIGTRAVALSPSPRSFGVCLRTESDLATRVRAGSTEVKVSDGSEQKGSSGAATGTPQPRMSNAGTDVGQKETTSQFVMQRSGSQVGEPAVAIVQVVQQSARPTQGVSTVAPMPRQDSAVPQASAGVAAEKLTKPERRSRSATSKAPSMVSAPGLSTPEQAASTMLNAVTVSVPQTATQTYSQIAPQANPQTDLRIDSRGSESGPAACVDGGGTALLMQSGVTAQDVNVMRAAVESGTTVVAESVTATPSGKPMATADALPQSGVDIHGAAAAGCSSVQTLERAGNPVLQAVASALQGVPVDKAVLPRGGARSPIATTAHQQGEGSRFGVAVTASGAAGVSLTANVVAGVGAVVPSPTQAVPSSVAAATVTAPSTAALKNVIEPGRRDANPGSAGTAAVEKSAASSSVSAVSAPAVVGGQLQPQVAVGAAGMAAQPHGATAAVAPVVLGAPLPGLSKPQDHAAAVLPSSIQAEVAAGGSDPTLTFGNVRLAQRAGQAEMTIGMNSTEFGSITIHTASTRDHVATELTVDHGELGRVLLDHLPEMQARLGNDRSVEVRMQPTSVSSGGVMQNAASGGGPRDGGAGYERQQAPTTRSTARAPTFDAVPLSVASAAARSETRLDVRV